MSTLNKNLIISDFDNTFYDFKKLDNEVIKQIFKGHKRLLMMDNFLWKLNKLGIVGNSMNGLKLRFLIYSIITVFSKSHIKYSYIYTEYETLYKAFAKKEYDKNKFVIEILNKKGYEFVILTNNKFASELKIKNIVYSKSKRKFLKTHIPVYLLGDNYWDDYRNCPKGTIYINVGNGIVSKVFKKNIFTIDNVAEIFTVIK